MADRTLLILGGSGFFGKSLLDGFARGLMAPWDIGRISIVARSASALARTHRDLMSDAVTLIDTDLARMDELPAADYVLHAASSTDAARYQRDPATERANILAALDRYAALARRVHRGARILYISSGAVYGPQPAEMARIEEAFLPAPVAGMAAYKRDYAEAKRLCEARVAALGVDGMSVGIARCFAFVGPYLPRDQHFAIGNFLADGLAGRPVVVTARQRVERSYMHADDLVRWLMTLAGHAGPGCPVTNVGSDEAQSVHSVAAMVAARFGVPVDAAPVDQPGIDRYVPAIDRARQHYGLALTHDLAGAIDAVARRLDAERRVAA